jgi:hypothetical protein
MNAQMLLDRMTSSMAPDPGVCDLPAALASHLASVADRLSPAEISRFVALGVAVSRRPVQVVVAASSSRTRNVRNLPNLPNLQ